MLPSQTRRRPLVVAAVALSLAVGLVACGSSDSDGASPSTTKAAGPTTTAEAKVEPLRILVSNDDGYAAEGISQLVTALKDVDGVTVTVVAPLEQQSGTGGTSTDGAVAVTDVELEDGYPAKAVDGFPADAIRVAMDELGIEPDLVITGINSGQNLGPLADASGTVGAARAAVARGVPALATSQGFGKTFDYLSATPFILDWVVAHRAAIAAGDEPVAVTNLNVPTCDGGQVRGLVETDADATADPKQALLTSDCASTVAASELDGDVALFNDGFATITALPDEPAVAPETVPAP